MFYMQWGRYNFVSYGHIFVSFLSQMFQKLYDTKVLFANDFKREFNSVATAM